jgi:tetratricopeptide (TPR) repeat protein
MRSRNRSQTFCLPLLLVSLVTGILHAGEASVAFDHANKLYEQGKYSESIAAYTNLLRHKETSAAVYFNLGNACFKNGQTGQAIAAYRLAQRLAPRDPDIRANLRFTRESLGQSSFGPGLWQRWFNMFTLNELTLAAVVALWLWLLVLAAGQFRRTWADNLRTYRMVLGLATGFLLAWLALVLQSRLGSTQAVVISRDAAVRYGPFEEAQRFYTARDGAEVAVLDRKENWVQVSDGSKRVGWLQAKDLVLLPRG